MHTAGVLVLDDDDELLSALAEAIVDLMGRTVVAVSSMAALTIRRDEALACDLAILDVNLGAGKPTGLDAFRWLRAQRFTGRVVFLTGHAQAHPALAELRKQEQLEIVEKPASFEVLERILRRPT